MLGFLAWLDVILVFVELLIVNSNGNKADGLSNLIFGVRVILALLFPNLTVKRGMYNLKVLRNDFCLSNANTVLARNFFDFFLYWSLQVFSQAFVAMGFHMF